MIDVAGLRKGEFAALDDGGTYLNSASIGPMPARSIAVLSACNRDRARPHLWAVERQRAILSESRWLCARLINAHEDEIALMTNTTVGLNVAARALPLGKGDVVLSFDGEFPANVYPWLALSANGVKLELLPRTAQGWPNEAALIEGLSRPEVKAVAVSLTQFANGYTIDLAALSRATRAAGKYLVVDAIQGVGQVVVDVQQTPVDFLSCGSQKWLLSPWGTGFLYVRKELCKEFLPTFTSWAAFESSMDYTKLTSYEPDLFTDAKRFELISLPWQDFAGMNASIGLLLGAGMQAISDYLRSLHAPILDWAKRGRGEISSPTDARGSAMICLKPHGDVAAAYQKLQEARITCSLREGAIRLSPHLFNEVGEMARVVEVV